jgi:hypothetical protein
MRLPPPSKSERLTCISEAREPKTADETSPIELEARSDAPNDQAQRTRARA